MTNRSKDPQRCAEPMRLIPLRITIDCSVVMLYDLIFSVEVMAVNRTCLSSLLIGLVSIAMLGGISVLAGECSLCKAQDETVLAVGCPFTRLIECWCEAPPDWVCCLYEHCEPLYFGGPCTRCEYTQKCFFHYPCEGPYPTKAGYFGGPGEP